MLALSAHDTARAQVLAVDDDPHGRLQLLHEYYVDGAEEQSPRLPFKRAATAFMRWQLRRGLLNPVAGKAPGSPWWRAINTRLLQDTGEVRALLLGAAGPPSSASVEAGLRFARFPTASSWYRAHNMSIVSAYLQHSSLARQESRVERFLINLVLLRVLYAHALVAAPRLALGRLGPIAPWLGDPRLGMTGIFLSLAHVLPDSYPLSDELQSVLARPSGFGRLLDIGVIQPRLATLYAWSAEELQIPELETLLCGQTPAYAWDPADVGPWHEAPGRLVGVARALLSAS